MAKLFALETTEDDPLEQKNQLLIDKVLQYDKQSKQGVSVTADLLKQRHELRQQITQELNEPQQDDNADNPQDNQNPSNSADGKDAGSSDASADESPETGSADDASAESDKPSGTDKDSSVKEKPAAQDDEESEESAAADDVESLRGLVGGGSKKETSTESYQTPVKASKSPLAPLSITGLHTALRNLFQPLKDSHNRRMAALESFELSAKPKVTEQPLVYVASEVTESLNRLIALANQYLQKNTGTITQGGLGLKELGEKLTVYREYVLAEKFHFSQALVQDKELLKALSIKDKNDLDYTSSLLAKHLQDSSALAVKLLQNPFEQIPDALSAGGYKDDQQGLFVNAQVLPGFYTLQASVVPFTNYIDAQYEEYQVFKVQVVKPQDLYSLPALSLDQDKDLKKLLSSLDKILISAGMILDNLKVVGQNYSTFIAAAKGLVYDVEKGTQTDLAGLGLNEKLQDFIKFKLVTEVYLNDFDLSVQYLSAALGVLGQLVELSDK